MINFKRRTVKIIALISAIMLIGGMISIPAFADEEPIDFGQFYGVVDTESLNVRAYASTDAPVVAELTNKQQVRVNWIEPEWVCVAYNNDGLMGYVSNEYIQVFEGELPETPICTIGDALVADAMKYLGTPYVWGGTTPVGFDCSGLMQYVFRELGYSLSRTTYTQVKEGVPVSADNLQPGDLLFFGSATSPSHVGMYIGDGKYIHAPHTGDVVKISELSSRSDFSAARRMLY